jgi:hypothetical protein
VDKEAREEFCDIVHDILNPYVSNFLPKQLAVLQSRLAGALTLLALLVLYLLYFTCFTSKPPGRCSYFTCFTGTKVQTLTPKAQLCLYKSTKTDAGGALG